MGLGTSALQAGKRLSRALSAVQRQQNTQRKPQAAHSQQGGGGDQGADIAAVIAHFGGQYIAAGRGGQGGESEQDGGMRWR